MMQHNQAVVLACSIIATVSALAHQRRKKNADRGKDHSARMRWIAGERPVNANLARSQCQAGTAGNLAAASGHSAKVVLARQAC
jgi:hypothetical protein